MCLGYCGGVCIGFEFVVGLPGRGMGWTLFSGSVLDMFWFWLGLWGLSWFVFFTDGCSVGMNVGNCRLVVVCCWFGGLLGCACVGLFYSASGAEVFVFYCGANRFGWRCGLVPRYCMVFCFELAVLFVVGFGGSCWLVFVCALRFAALVLVLRVWFGIWFMLFVPVQLFGFVSVVLLWVSSFGFVLGWFLCFLLF